MKLSNISKIAYALFAVVATSAAYPDNLVIQVTNLQPNRGNLMIAVFDSTTSKYFPDGAKVSSRQVHKVIGPQMTVTFKNIKTQSLAVAAFQDLNLDGELNMNWFPIPSPDEPVGFSNSYLPKFGPPNYREAEVKLPPYTLKLKLTTFD